MLSRTKRAKTSNTELTQRSQMYLDSNAATKKQYKLLAAVALISTVVIVILYRIGLFSNKPRNRYVPGTSTQKFEETTNKILRSWGSSYEALKFANLPSTGIRFIHLIQLQRTYYNVITAQGYLTVKAMVSQKDKTVKKQDIQIFYREASKLNPSGFGIHNKLQRLHKGIETHIIGGLKKGMQALQAKSPVSPPNELKKKADESMDDYVIDKDITLIFLHGKNYASSSWQELGTLDYFANLGYKIYGIDMPGYGHSQKVEVKSNEWLVDVITKLLSSQDEEGNIDQNGGEKKHKQLKNTVHKIAIVSPDVSGLYTLELLGNHANVLGSKQGLQLVKYVGIDVDIPGGAKDNIKNTDVEICNVVDPGDGGENSKGNDKLFGDNKKAQTVSMDGVGNDVYLDQPDVFHNVISEFLTSGSCKV